MDTIRIPTRFLAEILRDISQNKNKTEWSFTTNGGNVLVVRLNRGDRSETWSLWKHDGTVERHYDNTPWEALDFEWNPGD